MRQEVISWAPQDAGGSRGGAKGANPQTRKTKTDSYKT